MSLFLRVTVTMIVFGCLGCGGCGGHPKYTINDSVLADVPLADKQAMLNVRDRQAQLMQAQMLARSEQTVAKRDLEAADAETRIAQMEIAKVQADVDLAKSTTDLNRINRAKVRLTVAELGRKTADVKMQWRKLCLKYSEQQMRVLDRQAKYEEARYEQEKARLAAAKGKRPYANFSLAPFDLQVREAEKRWATERVDSDKLKQKIMQTESNYQQLQAQLTSARNAAPIQAVPPAPPFGPSYQ